jgi:acetyl esterase/lipase
MFTKYIVQRVGWITLLGALALSGVIGARAQDSTPTARTPMRVEVSAADGLTLVGDLYNAELNVQTPALLLMHMYGGKRTDWQPLIPALTSAGYRVITVDLRGHGETGGSNDWQAAIGDVQTWLDWMEAQPAIDPDKIAVGGASIGANLALVGCGNDAQCVTAVALSPGTDYFGVTTSSAMEALNLRSALLFASRSDRPSGSDVPQLLSAGTGEVAVQLFSGRAHGTSLLPARGVQTTIVNWLDDHLR